MTQDPKTLVFCYDYVSPNAYLAWKRLPDLAQRTGLTIEPRPILLGGLFKLAGNVSPASNPAKARNMMRDIQRFCALYKIPMAFNPHFPFNSLHMMRAAVAAKQEGNLEALDKALFEGIWEKGLNPTDPQALAAALTEAGLDPAHLMARAQEPAIKDGLKANTQQTADQGGFGAPTFFLGQEMFFGQDRLDLIEHAANG